MGLKLNLFIKIGGNVGILFSLDLNMYLRVSLYISDSWIAFIAVSHEGVGSLFQKCIRQPRRDHKDKKSEC